MNISNYNQNFRLYGDDFSSAEIEEWYNEEKEAYADLGSKDNENYIYQYHNQNKHYGFRHLPTDMVFSNALGVGSAYGDEFLPLINRIQKLTILEPSDCLRSNYIGNIVPRYIKPNIDGSISFDEKFDLITCFSVLHHIPNVTFVLNELIRILKAGGYMLLKEPISTMGDWSKKRKGLTKNERGIPTEFFDKIFENNKITVIKKTYFDSLFLLKILNKVGKINRNSYKYIQLDTFLSYLLKWNRTYHRVNNFQKIAPGAVFYVLKKS